MADKNTNELPREFTHPQDFIMPGDAGDVAQTDDQACAEALEDTAGMVAGLCPPTLTQFQRRQLDKAHRILESLLEGLES